MSDTITLPREVVKVAFKALVRKRPWSDADIDAYSALRTALAAEPTKQEPGLMEGLTELARQMKPLDADMAAILHDNLDSLYIEDEPALVAEPTKQEPVAWLSRDEARLALWKAINSREFGNPTDDKLILDHLRQQGLWIGKVTSPVPPEDEALRRDAELGRWLRDWLDNNGLLVRAIRGESLAGYEHPDIKALRRDAELGRWIREETPPIEEIAARVDAMEDKT